MLRSSDQKFVVGFNADCIPHAVFHVRFQVLDFLIFFYYFIIYYLEGRCFS